ncbi:MAG: cytochrome c [Nitrospinae bacterium]|nr:cytochrome c [Nitrospinota bacterium]
MEMILYSKIIARSVLLPAAVVLCVTTAARAEGPSSAEDGRQLYNKHCKQCHKLTEQLLVGPGLAGITKRRTEEWMDKWIASPKAVMASKDPVAEELRSGFKTLMPTLPAMADSQSRKLIIDFLKENDAENK